MKGSDVIFNLGRPMAYYPGLVKPLGSVNAVVMFCQLFYWTGKETSEHGIYKSVEELEQETGMTYREQVTARKHLASCGVLIETHKRLEHRIYYRIDLDVLNELLESANCGKRISADNESALPEVTKAHVVNKTEITSKTTAEKEAAASSSASLPPCPHKLLIDLFGKHLPTMPQPKIELWIGAKEEAMRARWKWVMTATKQSGARYATTKEEAVDFFERFFVYVSKSDFLTGRNEKWSRCNLAWLIKAENFSKVLEGHYENEAAS